MAYVGIGLETRKDVSYECLSNGRCKAKFTILNLTQADIQAAGGCSLSGTLAEGSANTYNDGQAWEVQGGQEHSTAEWEPSTTGERGPVSSAVNTGKFLGEGE